MNYDPREAKLPKWAQEMFAEVRTRSDLAWPTEPRPEPIVTADPGTGYARFGRGYEGEAWQVIGGHFGRRVRCVVLEQHGSQREPGSTDRLSGSRMGGHYYATERDAWLAAWWDECEAAASRIHAIAQRVRVLSAADRSETAA